jgi:hypothetical protein
MQNKFKLYSSWFVPPCAVWIFFLAGAGRGAEPATKPIEPFEGLQWTDGLVQTTQKINQMAGLEKFYAEGVEDGNLNKYSRDPGQWDQLHQAYLSGLENKAGDPKPDKSNDL